MSQRNLKGENIIVEKAREKIADRRTNEMAVVQYALIRVKKGAYNAISGFGCQCLR